jgi:hypothetical protein
LHSEFVKLLAARVHQRNPDRASQLRTFSVCALLALAVTLSGCGGGASSDPPAAGAPNVTLLMQDAPANGIAEFNIDVTNASLKDASGKSLTLGNSTETVEIRHLGLSPTVALQGFAAQTDSYTSLGLTFANPQLTVVNPQGQVIRVTAQSKPSVQLAGAAISLPLAATVGAADHVGVMLEFDLQHSISTDANGNYIIRPVVQASLVGNSAPVGLQGSVAVVSALFFNGPNLLSQVPINTLGQGASTAQLFQVQLLDSAQNVAVKVDSSTVMDPTIGQFSNIHLSQLIYLTADFQSDGTFLAKSIGAGPANLSQRYQGLITGVHRNSSGQSTFDVVVQN